MSDPIQWLCVLLVAVYVVLLLSWPIGVIWNLYQSTRIRQEDVHHSDWWL